VIVHRVLIAHCIVPTRGGHPKLVMRGLDPRIHPASQEAFSEAMDCRVKPGNDVVGLRRHSIAHRVLIALPDRSLRLNSSA
jgi:hypothetical protein